MTAAAHCGFLMNNYLLTYLKFKAFPHHLAIQVLNDFGCFITCFPMYALWAKNDYHKYFDKVPDKLLTDSEPFDPTQPVEKILDDIEARKNKWLIKRD